MVFSSVTFLFFFLPVVLLAYHLAPRRLRNPILLAASLVFYTWGTGWLVLVLLASIAGNYGAGYAVERAMDRDQGRAARGLLALAVLGNVALLAWFKYANFAAESLGGVLGALGESPPVWTEILLPIGISFYTFHSISYLVDLYRGTARHLVDPVDFALYITFFPQLVAGPIVRFHEIRDQLVERRETVDTFAAGVYRFCHGLGKKVLIADTIAPVADAAFGTPTGDLNTITALVGVTAYAVQLYFDFSGYSDMALGLAMLFGIHLPENFARPYAARSVTEFWRRWHMSLSRWFRDYLYVPLGGNRGSTAATYRNLIIVFLVTGLWHGAAWTFVLWGAFHGAILLVERATGIGRRAEGPDPIGRVRTIGLVLFAWILFRAPDLPSAVGYMGALLRPTGWLTPDVALALDPLAAIALAVGVATLLLPADWVTGVRLQSARAPRVRAMRLATVAVILPASIVSLVAAGFSPFLYFQF